MPKSRRPLKYKTYDPEKEGYGNPEQWKAAFNKRIGQTTTLESAHQILGTNKNSSRQDIKIAYRKLALKHHPDKCGNDTEFKSIASAYKTIKQNLELSEINSPIIVTNHQESTPSEFMPQLLNEISKQELEFYLTSNAYCAQEKHDGHRKTIISKNGIISINNKKGQPSDISEHIKTQTLSLNRNFVIDGEWVNNNFYLFDILSIDDQDLRNLPYKERFQFQFSSLSIIPVETAYTEQEKRNLLKYLQQNSKEGIVFKKIDGIHHSGYHNDHVKFKFYATASVIVIRQNQKSSVGVGVYQNGNLIEIGNVTTLGHEKPNVNDIIEVKYLYANRGGSLYQTSLIGSRDDQYPTDCTIDKIKFKGEFSRE